MPLTSPYSPRHRLAYDVQGEARELPPRWQYRRVTQATHWWTPTYGLWRTAIRRALRRSYLFWPAQILGLIFAYLAIASAIDYGLDYLAYLVTPVLLFTLPEATTLLVLRDPMMRAPRRLSWNDERVWLETAESRTEFRWSAVGWSWQAQHQVVLARPVRVRLALIAVVPDDAFVSEDQCSDLFARIGKARRTSP